MKRRSAAGSLTFGNGKPKRLLDADARQLYCRNRPTASLTTRNTANYRRPGLKVFNPVAWNVKFR